MVKSRRAASSRQSSAKHHARGGRGLDIAPERGDLELARRRDGGDGAVLDPGRHDLDAAAASAASPLGRERVAMSMSATSRPRSVSRTGPPAKRAVPPRPAPRAPRGSRLAHPRRDAIRSAGPSSGFWRLWSSCRTCGARTLPRHCHRGASGVKWPARGTMRRIDLALALAAVTALPSHGARAAMPRRPSRDPSHRAGDAHGVARPAARVLRVEAKGNSGRQVQADVAAHGGGARQGEEPRRRDGRDRRLRRQPRLQRQGQRGLAGERER